MTDSAQNIEFSATYSAENNKLRLTASDRLPAALYERVRALGFRWAPMQEIFIAPRWTPNREDLCIELAGQIMPEESTMVERAAIRAARFDGYQAARLSDSDAFAKAAGAYAARKSAPSLQTKRPQRRIEPLYIGNGAPMASNTMQTVKTAQTCARGVSIPF